MVANFSFITDLENNYHKNPAVCYYCGKPLSFNKFYKQYECSKKFCSKKCKNQYIEETGDVTLEKSEFSSQTEKAIHAYLTLQYPNVCIKHNIKDIFPPYEIDLCLEFEQFPIYIEYNGSLHCTRKKRNSNERKLEKRKINDHIKKEELCSVRKQKLIRLWSEIGIYSKPDLFDRALKKLKEEIDILIRNGCDGGKCIEIILDRSQHFHRYSENFREN